jgi:antitoxin component HigA of HigAB toxin-antitoxin module
MPARPIRIEKERWYVYLLLKHFKGDTSKFSRTMDISKKSIETWKEHHYEDMKEFIKKERKCDRNGGEVPFEERETPTPEALREECLKRMEEAIKLEQDPAKLARAVETLNKLMDPTGKAKEKKSISDAVLESIKK